MKAWIAIFILLIGLRPALAGTTSSVACVFTTISNALVNAQEGDEINVQAGSCTWESEIVLNNNRSFAFRGAGTNSTTFISAAIGDALWWRSNSSNLVTISDFNVVGHANNAFGFFLVGGNPPDVTMKGPTHFYNIRMTNCAARGIAMGYGDSFGLIDHCLFVHRTGTPQAISFGGNDYRSWTNATNPMGTTNVVCVESCDFYGGNGGNGFFDAYNGAQLTWRYNHMDGGAPSGVHGYDSQPHSARTWEIYNNVWTNGTNNVLTIELRGGTGVVFSNTVDVASDFCELAYYRSCDANHHGTVLAYGLCSGATTNVLDGNIDGTGYPGYEQPGVIRSTPTNNTMTLQAAYAWGNTFGGVSQGFTLKDNDAICSYNITNLVKLNRNYFNTNAAPVGYAPLAFPHPILTASSGGGSGGATNNISFGAVSIGGRVTF